MLSNNLENLIELSDAELDAVSGGNNRRVRVNRRGGDGGFAIAGIAVAVNAGNINWGDGNQTNTATASADATANGGNVD